MKNFDHFFYDKKTGLKIPVHFERLLPDEAELATDAAIAAAKKPISQPIRMPDLPSVKKDGLR